MNTYAYRIYKNGRLDHPIIGGTISAKSMDDATIRIIKRDGVKAVHVHRLGYRYSHFEYKGQRVGLLIYINPEDY